MTFSKPTVDHMRIEAFRGFRDEREFDLAANAVVVSGPNGTGKTSFFDAMQWCFLGRIERLEVLRSRKNTEHIVNQYRKGQKATVEITLGSPSGAIVLRRTGDQGGSTLEIERQGAPTLFGDEAEAELRNLLLPNSELRLNTAMTTSGLMQQDVLRRLLEAKPADRYQEMSAVLGLGSIEEFEDATRQAAKRAAEREASVRVELTQSMENLKQARDRLESSQVRLSSRPHIEAIRGEIAKVLDAQPEGVNSTASKWSLATIDEVRHAVAQFGRALESIEEVHALVKQALVAAEQPIERPSESQIDALRADLSDAEMRRELAEHLRGRAQSELNNARLAAADVAKLAALAIPMLSNDCPVCGQAIDRDHVERELLVKANATGALLELEREFVRLHNDFAEASEESKRLRQLLDSSEKQIEYWQEQQSKIRAAESAIHRFDSEIEFLRLDRVDLQVFASVAPPVAQYLRLARRSMQDLMEAFDRPSEQGDLERTAAEIAAMETSIANVRERLESESERSRRIRNLSEVTVEARVDVTEQRLRSLQPLVSDIYQRLDPHPAFKSVDFELDTYYRRGTTSPLVVDPIEDISADPALIFSTSQANIVALSYFIAMNLSMESAGLPFLLLDDPVQSMDDVNVLGFADLCRHLRLRRQLMVSTHERRLTNLLERKLAPRLEASTTRIIRFTGWDRSGPTVEETQVDGQLIDNPIRLLRDVG